MPALYLNTGREAGDEISSTSEGRHVSLEESYLIHPYHADGFVDKGDPVYVGENVVGVALNSAAAATDIIAIDTEGIWFLNVMGAVDDGSADGLAQALIPGSPIYIEKATAANAATTIGYLTGRADPSHFVPFGFALGDVTAHVTTRTVTAVKVHGTFLPNSGQVTIGSGTSLPMLLEGAVASASEARGRNSYYGLATLAQAGEEITGEMIRIEDNLASTGGTVAGLFVKAYANNAANVLTGLLGVKIGIANTLSNGIANVVGLDISMGGAGTAPVSRIGIQMFGDGTAGTAEGWFLTTMARGLGLKANAAAPGNTTHEIPIYIDGTRYCIPVHAWQ